MDLREFGITCEQAQAGCKVLDYQPFILSDDLQTGVAYSWRYSSDSRVAPPLVFDRQEHGEQWDKVTEINSRQRRTYDGFIRAIAARYPNATLLDMACNNGYFPIRAELFGMAPSTGMDLGGHYQNSINFLNEVCGTHASFAQTYYDPQTHSAPIEGQFDVVMATAISCHLPDPLNFLAFLASRAREAIFFWDQVIDTDDLLVSFRPPHFALHGRPFPFCFNDNTRMSRGLLELSLKQLGFKEIVELPWQDDWLSPYITSYWPESLKPAAVAACGAQGALAAKGYALKNELAYGSKHVPILAMR